MKIDRPIFIMAPARSGTTIFYNLFTRHKDTAFPEHFADKYWSTPWKIRIIPFMVKQQIWRYKKRPLPHEGKFWRKFHDNATYLEEMDITDEEEKYLFSSIKAQLKALKAERFVDRGHDFCLRIRFLNALFPNAFFIIVRRDPRAVINSQYQMLMGSWQKGENYGRIIEKFEKDNSKLYACIKYFQHFIKTMEKDIPLIKTKTIEVKYEDFVHNPRYELKNVYEFVELPWYKELEKEIPSKLELKNNEKWRMLPDREKRILESSF